MAVAPFTLDVALLTKAWGGARLGALFGDPRDGLGEAWLCADLAETAQSGAGGQAMISAVVPTSSPSRSVAELGDAAARGEPVPSAASVPPDLHAVLAQDPISLLGFHAQRFPLLVKYLDAAEHLSVQVHPSPAYARTHPGAHVKSEAWVVLEAELGAELMLGVKDLPDAAALAAAIHDDSLPTRLVRIPATAGTACWLPPGLIHALGAGSLVLEVQTASDTTYRLHDWTDLYDRAPREMHVEAGVEAALLDAVPVPGRLVGEAKCSRIIETPDFEIGAVIGPSTGPAEGPLAVIGSPRALLVIPVGEAVALTGPWGTMEAPAHRVTIVPAAVAAACRVEVPAATRTFVVRVLGG